MHWKKVVFYSCLFFFTSLTLHAQQMRGDSWKSVQEKKKGTITAMWYDLEPFIYQDNQGRLQGIEYELMESFKPWLKNKYGIELRIDWVKGPSFEEVYTTITESKLPGIFGWSYFSITPERRQEVKFTPAYMPDLNVLITHSGEPSHNTTLELAGRLKSMRGYTMINTSMEDDMKSLQESLNLNIPIIRKREDYEVMQDVADDVKGFAYVPLSVYINGLQRGIRIKRQQTFTSRREGIAGLMSTSSDWGPIIEEFFTSSGFRFKTSMIVSRYLGSEVKELILEEKADTIIHPDNDLSLVSLEKDIVTRRLMDAALEVQQQRFLRNGLLLITLFVLVLGGLLYSRYRSKQKMTAALEQHNQVIQKQKEQIEQMNQLLKLKVLQARMNPHFIFNSLNALQYFIALDDKKTSLQYISRFSGFLRKVIQSGDELFIPVSEEAALLKEYLWLEQARFPGKFEFEVKMASDAQQQTILPLLTHSLVEDALYRGVLNLPETAGKIVIEFREENETLLVQVTDNGLSREHSIELEKKKGLQSSEEPMITKRIKLFNRQGNRKIGLNRFIETIEGESINKAVLGIPQPLFERTIM